MVFRLPEARCPTETENCKYDKLILYVVPGQDRPIEQFTFYTAQTGPPYEFWVQSGGITRTYQVLLGDCSVTPNRPCSE